MNTGNGKKKWYKYCLDSKILDKNGMSELRLTKDVEGYNPEMYVIVIYSTEGGIEETLSENIYTKEQILKMWQEWKSE